MNSRGPYPHEFSLGYKKVFLIPGSSSHAADLLPPPAAATAVACLVVDSPVGVLVLSDSDGGLSALEWRHADDSAHRAAVSAPATALLSRAADQLAEYFAGRRRTFELPLAPRGSPFQRRVWAEMRRIPYGDTASYGALARRLSSAARAVGGACGANPLPIFIPCHRVVAAGGALGGFSGGAGRETKRFLLRHEGLPL